MGYYGRTLEKERTGDNTARLIVQLNGLSLFDSEIGILKALGSPMELKAIYHAALQTGLISASSDANADFIRERVESVNRVDQDDEGGEGFVGGGFYESATYEVVIRT